MPVTSPLLKTRLDYLEAELKQEPPGFILTADLLFAVFRYDPSRDDEGEWLMRREIQNLKVRVENATGRAVHLISLADLFWCAIEHAEGIDAVVQLERSMGFEDAQRQVGAYLSSDAFCPLPDLLAEAIAPLDPKRNFVFVTRAAVLGPDAYPVSILLEQLLGRVKVPGILFYPGTWAGSLNFLGLRAQNAPMSSYRVTLYKWFHLAKGGNYSPYYSNINLVINWERYGKELADSPQAVIRNPHFYFYIGLTWPRCTSSGISVRALPQGCVFADKSPTAFDANPMSLLGIMQSAPFSLLVSVQLAAARSYEVGIIQQTPVPDLTG